MSATLRDRLPSCHLAGCMVIWAAGILSCQPSGLKADRQSSKSAFKTVSKLSVWLAGQPTFPGKVVLSTASGRRLTESCTQAGANTGTRVHMVFRCWQGLFSESKEWAGRLIGLLRVRRVGVRRGVFSGATRKRRSTTRQADAVPLSSGASLAVRITASGASRRGLVRRVRTLGGG